MCGVPQLHPRGQIDELGRAILDLLLVHPLGSGRCSGCRGLRAPHRSSSSSQARYAGPSERCLLVLRSSRSDFLGIFQPLICGLRLRAVWLHYEGCVPRQSQPARSHQASSGLLAPSAGVRRSSSPRRASCRDRSGVRKGSMLPL